MDVLESCANTCARMPAEYQQCWVNGLEALNQNPNLNLANRKALIKLLKANLKKAREQDFAEQSSDAPNGHEGRKRKRVDQDTRLPTSEEPS